MIRCIVGDVEITPNFFSITFINLTDYLQKCKCMDGKHNVPLIRKYKVDEIKAILDTVEREQFWITDYDDSQLFKLLGYINDMQRKNIVKRKDNGEEYTDHIVTDFYGYNILGYDNLMIAAFLMYFNRFDNTKALITHLYNVSKQIIELQQSNIETYYENPTMKLLRNYRMPYRSVDVMTLFALNKAGVLIDKDSGERKTYPKSLKQTSINLQWHELLEFELPIIDDEERVYYKNNMYNDMTNEELTKLISQFNRYIIPKYIPSMMHYNLNDCYIVCEIVRQKIEEVRLRYSISQNYNVNVLSSSRSNIADKLSEKFYSERSGLHPSKFKNTSTIRTKLSFNKIIFNNINFKTEQMQIALKEMKDVVIYRTNKQSFTKEVTIDNLTYTIATGGLHSQDVPQILKSTDKFTYVHWDIGSFYPSLMINYEICPKHLNKAAFIGMLRFLRDTRINAKHGGDIEVIEGIPNKVVAEVLKIVINALYGKLGFEKSWLYDRFAQMQVTINGQLMIMMLIEELSINGIRTMSANTDGIVIKLYNDKIKLFEKIADRWKKLTGFEADSESYELYINRDINNYVIKELNGKISYKGALDPKQYIKDLQKGYNMPVVAEAITKYLIDNIPIMDTLMNNNNILDFCKTQNVGRKYHVEFTHVVDGKLIVSKIQRNVRFYIGLNGGTLKKVSSSTEACLAAGQRCVPLNSLDDLPINKRNIDYKYYYNAAFKITNTIMLGISQKGKGKTRARKYGGMYNNLFDLDDSE